MWDSCGFPVGHHWSLSAKATQVGHAVDSADAPAGVGFQAASAQVVRRLP